MPALLPACGSRERCDCGGLLETRKDDTAAVVETRLEVYDREAAPLLEWYRARGRLLVFAIRRGLQDVPKLEAAILGRLL
jgi:adenylate kinase family enzyme